MREELFRESPVAGAVYYTWFAAMHTRIDLILCGQGESAARSLADLVEDAIAAIERKVNRFDSQSDLSLLNARRSTSLDRELYAMIRDAVRWHGHTGGYFDPAVQSPAGSRGVQGLYFDDEALAIGFADDSTVLDLNGYVKGYALDRSVELLRRAGVRDALVNIGNSSVAAIGRHPHGEGWKVGVEAPWPPGGMLLEPVLAPGEVLTTSGNDAVGRAHIIDPVLGEFRRGEGMVSVRTRSGVAGEALSTALFAASPDLRNQMALLPECLEYWEMVP